MKKKWHKDPELIKSILDKCDACYIGMVDTDNKPYVLPFNFGYDGRYLYFHCAPGGKKNDILKVNKDICVAFSTDHKLAVQSEKVACSHSMKFRSVLAYGKVEFVEDYDAKIEALNHIMKKYTGKEFSYNAPAVNNIQVFKMKINTIKAKESGY